MSSTRSTGECQLSRTHPASGSGPGVTRRALLVSAAVSCATPVHAAQAGIARVMDVPVAFEMRAGRSPTVVFESGLGDGMAPWRPVIARLDPAIGYLAYDRPGYGRSGAVLSPDGVRDSRSAVDLLHGLLEVLGAPGPYVLVGHSLGGLYIAKYAETYRSEVAGLVFVDGRPPRFRTGCDVEEIRFCSTEGATPPPANWPAHIVQESAGLKATEEMAPAAAALEMVPATIITSTNVWPGEQGAEGFALWLRTQEEFAGAFSDHRFVRAEGSGHSVHREHPELVAREIEALLLRIGELR